MENLYGHEAGNGGYCQGDTYGNSPFLDPTKISRAADPEMTAKTITECILSAYEELKTKTPGKLIEERYRRFRKMGSFMEAEK